MKMTRVFNDEMRSRATCAERPRRLRGEGPRVTSDRPLIIKHAEIRCATLKRVAGSDTSSATAKWRIVGRDGR